MVRAVAVEAWEKRTDFIPGTVVEGFVVLELPVYFCQFFAMVTDDLHGTS